MKSSAPRAAQAGRVDATDHIVLTKEEVADLLRVRPSTVEAMARRGDLPSFFVGVGTIRRYKRAAVMDYLDGR